MDLGPGVIYQILEAPGCGDAKLALFEEVGSKVLVVSCHDVLAGDSAECKAHGNGSELGGVVWVFVQCHEVAGCKSGCQGRGNLVVSNEANESGKPAEVGFSRGVFGLMEGKGAGSVREVSKGPSCCAFLEASECLVKNVGVNGDGRWGCAASSGSMCGLIRCWWWVELLAGCFNLWGDGCHWH